MLRRLSEQQVGRVELPIFPDQNERIIFAHEIEEGESISK